MDKTRAGIQSVEVGFALVGALVRASGSLMQRDLDLDAMKLARELGHAG